MPGWTVITPTLPERAPFLGELAHDLAAQTVDWEWLIGYDWDRQGPAAVRNHLAAQADATWLVFVDDDDRLRPDFLEILGGLDGEVRYTLCDVTGRDWEPSHDCTHSNLQHENTVPVTAAVDARWFWLAGGFPLDERNEDHALWQKLHSMGARFTCSHERAWTYRFHGNNRSLA